MKTAACAVVLSSLAVAACHVHRIVIRDGTVISGAGVIQGDLSEKAEKTESVDLALGPTTRLTLRTRYGPIRVRTTTGQPKVEARFVLHARTKAEAEGALAGFQLAKRETAAGVEVSEEGDPVAVVEGSTTIRLLPVVELVASVPAGVSVTADAGSGNIDVRGPLGSCTVATRYGKVEVADITGDLSATSSSGTVEVTRVRQGRVTVKSSYGNLTLADIEGTGIVAETSSGNVEASDLRAPRLELRSKYGKLTIANVRGTVIGDTSSGSIHLRDAEGDEIALSTGYGPITVESTKAAICAKSSSGNVDVQGDGAVNAETTYGWIKVTGRVTSLTAHSSSGNVTVDVQPGSVPTGAWSLRSGYGKIVATLPHDFACELHASTTYGRVDCAFPVLLQPGRLDPKEMQGKIGEGGPELRIHTASGNIDIRKHPGTR